MEKQSPVTVRPPSTNETDGRRDQINQVITATRHTLRAMHSAINKAVTEQELSIAAAAHLPATIASINTLKHLQEHLSEDLQAPTPPTQQPKRKRAEEQEFCRAKKLHQQVHSAQMNIDRLESRVGSSKQKRKQLAKAKQLVNHVKHRPCYFFSRGSCSKGSRCPFLHKGLVQPSIGTRAHGTILQWHSDAPAGAQQYGFIEEESTRMRYYCNQSSLSKPTTILQGTPVIFTIGERPDPFKLQIATHVQIRNEEDE